MTGRQLISAFALLILRRSVIACACGCSVFTAGARWTMPTSSGFTAYLQYDFMDQTRNWGAWQSADPATNPDREIRTRFYTIGAEDSGPASFPGNTGYERLSVVPGVQVPLTARLTAYTDLRIPVVTHVRGVQLVAPGPAGLTMGYAF